MIYVKSVQTLVKSDDGSGSLLFVSPDFCRHHGKVDGREALFPGIFGHTSRRKPTLQDLLNKTIRPPETSSAFHDREKSDAIFFQGAFRREDDPMTVKNVSCKSRNADQ